VVPHSSAVTTERCESRIFNYTISVDQFTWLIWVARDWRILDQLTWLA